MDDSPIAGEETALGRRNDFSEGCNAVLQRHGVTAFVRSGLSDSMAFDHSPLVAASAYALDLTSTSGCRPEEADKSWHCEKRAVSAGRRSNAD
jgi:hypothetical protein